MSECQKCGFDPDAAPITGRRRKPQDTARYPPGMGSAAIEAVIDSICRCEGRWDCDCVSVFNKAKIQAWTEHNMRNRKPALAD